MSVLSNTGKELGRADVACEKAKADLCLRIDDHFYDAKRDFELAATHMVQAYHSMGQENRMLVHAGCGDQAMPDDWKLSDHIKH